MAVHCDGPPAVSESMYACKTTGVLYPHTLSGKGSTAGPVRHGTDDRLDRDPQPLRPPELPRPPDRIKHWQNFEREERAAEEAADHRRRHPPQDLRPGTLRP